jgi:hypothetical protein
MWLIFKNIFIKEILKQWESHIIPEEFKIPLFNIILKKSNFKALELEEDLLLPSHIPMPSIKPSEAKDSKN